VGTTSSLPDLRPHWTLCANNNPAGLSTLEFLGIPSKSLHLPRPPTVHGRLSTAQPADIHTISRTALLELESTLNMPPLDGDLAAAQAAGNNSSDFVRF
jgi:hypothetical protein